ncbi:MAG TPA: prephenate dehydrogenase [Longimicrobiaceae bacterium]|nr:prephenate dehydrogenase [Longimicrobiaceae bacterium]
MIGFRSAAVFGLGLIGGSLARSLTGSGVRVLGYDRDPDVALQVLDDGGIAAILNDSLEEVQGVDLVILAVPVTEAPLLLEKLTPLLNETTLITDVGSTKKTIVAAAEQFGLSDRFVGSHPLSGDHRSGWAASRNDLFDGSRVYLCPSRRTPTAVLKLAEKLWMDLGAHTEITTPEEHDGRMAWISHLPQLTSSALALALRDAGVSRSELGPGGHDMTRMGGSSPAMWTAICRDNPQQISAAILSLEAQLRRLRAQLTGHEADELPEMLEAARVWSASDTPR